MNCPNCGIEIDDNEKICTLCGYVFEDENAAQYEQTSEPSQNVAIPIQPYQQKKSKGLLTLVIVLSVIVLGLAAVVIRFYLDDKSDDKTTSLQEIKKETSGMSEQITSTEETEAASFMDTSLETEEILETVTETTAALLETEAPTTAKQTSILPSIKASIDVKTSDYGDGATFYLNVSGTYDYYIVDVYAYYNDSEYEYLGESYSSDTYFYLTAGSVYSYVTAAVTPYMDDGTKGDTINCRGDVVYTGGFVTREPEVIPCSYFGQINTHGGVVAGFAGDYILYGASASHIRDSLGNGWHVTAVSTCTSRGIQWYELYDTNDGDYYGWVDEYYIDFYQ